MTDDPEGRSGISGTGRLRVETNAILEALVTGPVETSVRRNGNRKTDLTHSDVLAARTAIASVRAAILDEVRRHEAHIFNAETSDSGDALDLDAARLEIGRRLDRIRLQRG